MAAPSHESSTETTGSLEEPVMDMPAIRPADDFYIVILAQDDSNYIFDTPPAPGWTTITQGTQGTSTRLTAWKKGGDSEPPSYTFTSNNVGNEMFAGNILRYSGQDGTSPIGAISSVNTGSTGTATALALTATSDDSIILRCYFVNRRIFTAGGNSAGIIRGRTAVVDAGAANSAVAEEASPGNGVSTGTHTWTLDVSDAWSTITIEVMPSVSTGPAIAPLAMHHQRQQR